VAACVDRSIELVSIEASMTPVPGGIEHKQGLTDPIQSFLRGGGLSMSISRGALAVDRIGGGGREYQGASPPHNPVAQRDLTLSRRRLDVYHRVGDGLRQRDRAGDPERREGTSHETLIPTSARSLRLHPFELTQTAL